MPDIAPSFEHAALEADMKTLAAEIRSQRERPELKNAAEKELVREAIKAFPGAESKPQSVPQASGSQGVSKGPLPAYADSASPEVKLEIEYLLDLALHQGLSKAFAESRKSPYFVQDAFHDSLAGKLYPELQKRGVVK